TPPAISLSMVSRTYS
ncbi:hypothetical protein EC07798_0162, partial [Escherichia coli 07798]